MLLAAATLSFFSSSCDDAAPSKSIPSEQTRSEELVKPADTSLRTPEKGARVFLIGDFLYWSAQAEGMDLGFKAKEQSGNLPLTDVTIKSFDNVYKPGFRVGLGYRLPHDSWEARAFVTQFRTTNHLKQAASGAKIIEPNLGLLTDALSPFDRQIGHWHLKYTLFDVELSRSFAASKAFVFSPFVGGRGVWIHQKEHLSFSGMQVLSVDADNHYRAGGLHLGADLYFYLMDYVCFFGEATANLVWGRFEEQTRMQLDHSPLFSAQAKPRRLSGDCELRAGAKGTIPLYRRQAFLTFGLTYDMTLWFLYNQLLSFFNTSDALQMQVQQGNLTLHGISFTTRLDF